MLWRGWQVALSRVQPAWSEGGGCAGKFYCKACTAELESRGDLPDNLEEAADAPWCFPARDEFRGAEQLLGSSPA